MADVLKNGARPVAEQSTGELVQRASEQISRLVRDELALAKAELAEKGKHAGLGIGLFGGGGALAFYGLGALVATGILLLDLVLPAWAAALIVTVVLFVMAGVLALVGRRQVKQAVPPTPSAAAMSVRADVDAVTSAIKKDAVKQDAVTQDAVKDDAVKQDAVKQDAAKKDRVTGGIKKDRVTGGRFA
ncbi:hypothetical protein Pa4123_90280 [Phytohabitans aurantiacus]|uniref:Transporter n=1 Tax=Phytohabitans aurantiacus TaxID=3016789 RepID=A0ABQ5RBF7_9ACTN|nr:hypothetical protein Pa4123_90280 [Phytohabitans aurantiacus]